jgi:hypothetical protein
MCDYSLHTVASRPAVVGDKLVTTGFVNTYTRGFASEEQLSVAVCLLPGTEIAFEKNVEWGGLLRFFRTNRPVGKLARFTQINMGQTNAHHDALVFPNGKVVLLTHLREGQRATILQLPARANVGREHKVQETRPTAEGAANQALA